MEVLGTGMTLVAYPSLSRSTGVMFHRRSSGGNVCKVVKFENLTNTKVTSAVASWSGLVVQRQDSFSMQGDIDEE